MVLTPTWEEFLESYVDSRMLDVHTALPALVVAFDDAENTVDVTPAVKRRTPAEDGGTVAEDVPTIQDVPVAWPGSGSVYLKWQIQKGSTVLLVFNESSIAQFRETGQVSEPGDLARHDLSYPYALPIRGPKEGPGAVGATFVVDAPEIKLGEAAAELVALANLVDDRISTLQAKMDDHVHPTGMGPSGVQTTPLGAQDSVACTKVKAE